MTPRWVAALALALMLASCAPRGGRPAGSADLLVLRGNLSARNGEYGRATVAYLAAFEKASRAAAPYVEYDLGNVYASLGEPAAARDTITRALEGQGRELLFRAQFNLGALEYEQGRFEDAANSYVEALRQKPGDVDAKVNLELALRKMHAGAAQREISTASAQRIDRRTSEILDIARQKETHAWQSAPRQPAPEKGNDW